MLTATAYDRHVAQLFDRVQQLHALLAENDIPYRIVGGLAVFIHVSERDPIRARLTPDIDAALQRSDLPRLMTLTEKIGLRHRNVAGVDILTDADQTKRRSVVHLILLDEQVLDSLPALTQEGIPLAPVADLVRMKLTSFRLKDRVHIQDLDGVGLITPEIESTLPAPLLDRLHEVRKME